MRTTVADNTLDLQTPGLSERDSQTVTNWSVAREDAMATLESVVFEMVERLRELRSENLTVRSQYRALEKRETRLREEHQAMHKDLLFALDHVETVVDRLVTGS